MKGGNPLLARLHHGVPVQIVRGMRSEVRDAVSTTGLLTLGVTVGIEVLANNPFDRISIAAMLISTKDGFFGVTCVPLPRGNDVLFERATTLQAAFAWRV